MHNMGVTKENGLIETLKLLIDSTYGQRFQGKYDFNTNFCITNFLRCCVGEEQDLRIFLKKRSMMRSWIKHLERHESRWSFN